MTSAKVSVLEMILACESECDRIDVWQTVLKAEGTAMDPSMARRRMIFRKMADTLEIVLLHQAEFSKIAKAKRRTRDDPDENRQVNGTEETT